MNASFAALAYLVSGVLFSLSLRGLSSPETSRQGNTFGMVGMALAVAVTLLTLWSTGTLDTLTLGLIAGGVIVGGGAGALIAGRVQMTQMPQLVAAFHSLVGMAACLVAIGAVYAPESFGIATADGGIKSLSIVELALGLAIGAMAVGAGGGQVARQMGLAVASGLGPGGAGQCRGQCQTKGVSKQAHA
jgi:NAD(P) transhydrogenase subunit beta